MGFNFQACFITYIGEIIGVKSARNKKQQQQQQRKLGFEQEMHWKKKQLFSLFSHLNNNVLFRWENYWFALQVRWPVWRCAQQR